MTNTLTDTFPESHRATAPMMSTILVMGAGFFDLLDGAVSKNPPLFVAGVLFCCSGSCCSISGNKIHTD